MDVIYLTFPSTQGQGGTGIGEKERRSILDVNKAGKLISEGPEAVG